MHRRIWKLTPIQRTAKIEPLVVVRASSEKEARRLAASGFDVATKVKPSDDTPRSPRGDPVIVDCVSILDEKYSADGPAAILYPENA